MRILIDLQAGQSAGSRNRGIGRYSTALAKAIIRQKGEHEIFIALNGAFPETINQIRDEFRELLPNNNIQVWNCLDEVSSLDEANNWRRHSMQLMREVFFANLRPDITLVFSLFEGLSDNAVTSINYFPKDQCTAVILYDLIPLIYQAQYLEHSITRDWYLEKIQFLKKANLLLSISESSRQNAISYLDIKSDSVVNILGDADEKFNRKEYSDEAEKRIRNQYKLQRPFIMYTGGIDHRKNLHRLIRAYAKLPKSIREHHQLAIVCSAQASEIAGLVQFIQTQNLHTSDVILTGYVPDEDLVQLYSLCALFVFPSWHEGFGLPALEAMRCGAPVITSNNSSLPEIVGLKEAQFDPFSEAEIALLIERGLVDLDYRARLLENAKRQSQEFSWDLSAKKTLHALESVFTQHRNKIRKDNATGPRKRLAFVSPLPPARSGIADYSAELIPHLSKYYDIDLIVDQSQLSEFLNLSVKNAQWFIDHQHEYDRVLYHVGNSTFHQHMFDLLECVPGVTVLHDFYLSGILAHLDRQKNTHQCWARALYTSHGYHAVAERYFEVNSDDVLWRYPANGEIIKNSLGIITHSQNTRRLAAQWFDERAVNAVVIPLMRDPHCALEVNKQSVRQKLGFADDDFIVCSFGFLGPTKLNHRLLKAWLQSSLAEDQQCRLIFVGENSAAEYGMQLSQDIKDRGTLSHIEITGWVNADQYHQFLGAADVAVQLRSLSRGETSAAVLDCMNYGLATIINAHGSMTDIDSTLVWMMEDNFEDAELIAALEAMWQNRALRQKLGSQAQEHIHSLHSPEGCAQAYYFAIEEFYNTKNLGVDAIIEVLDKTPDVKPCNQDLLNLAYSMDANLRPLLLNKQLFLDVSSLIGGTNSIEGYVHAKSVVESLLKAPPANYRVEPIYFTADVGYRYARNFTLQVLGCIDLPLIDQEIEYRVGDCLMNLQLDGHASRQPDSLYAQLHMHGVKFVLLKLKSDISFETINTAIERVDLSQAWMPTIESVDGILCESYDDYLANSHYFSKKTKDSRTEVIVDWISAEEGPIYMSDSAWKIGINKPNITSSVESFFKKLSKIN